MMAILESKFIKVKFQTHIIKRISLIYNRDHKRERKERTKLKVMIRENIYIFFFHIFIKSLKEVIIKPTEFVK